MAYTVTNNPWTSQYNVGIGTDSVDDKLHLYGAGSATQIIEAGTNDAQINYKSGGVAKFLLGYTSSTDGFRFVDTVAGNVVMYIKSNDGRIGIGTGTAAPANKLTIETTTSDSYTPADFNNNSVLGLKSVGADNSYTGIQFTNEYGNYEKFIGSVQTASNTADIVFQGYDRGASVYKEYMRIAENGKVGIGTASPVSSLQVGTAAGSDPTTTANIMSISANRAFTSGYSGQLLVQPSDYGQDYGGMITFGMHRASSLASPLPVCAIAGRKEEGTSGNYSAYLHFGTRANGGNITEKMRITSAGNVGIGTAAPSNALTVNKAISNDFVVELKQTHSTAGQAWGVQICGGTNSSDAALVVENEAENASLLYVRGDGNVGIGTASPAQALTVTTSGVTKIEIESTAASSTAPTVSIYGKLKYQTDGAQTNFGQIVFGKLNSTSANTAGYTAFYKKPAGATYTEAMRIDPDGKLGINRTAPDTALDVAGVGNNAVITLRQSGGSKMLFMDTSSGVPYLKLYASNGSTEAIKFNTGGDSWFNGGNVGIGTNSPGYKLEVNGTFYSAGSSVAYKENIEDLEVDSSLIHSLRPVSYDYKKKYKDFGYNVKDGKQMGLISEEVAETIPELAIMKDGRPKNVDYQKLAVVLLAEVQNLKKDIEELKK